MVEGGNLIMSATKKDLDFIVTQKGSLDAAIAYCDRMASLRGPLSKWYEIAGDQLRARRAILPAPETKHYEVIGYRVDPRDERKRGVPLVLCPGPFTHKEALTVISKFTPRRDFAITVRELA
jgi:hypothetical protein